MSELEQATAEAPRPFTGRVALVVGAGAGVGEATARLLAERGAAVVVADRDAAGVERLANELSGAGAETPAVSADATDGAAVGAMLEAAIGRFG
ncbi:MAG: SDR family NAD(P)-dependent oxidoreductase, partial [Chloroflexi bacterium]|nr:SDR family NAD(P)-dependent oxidoreductase [Chloroflexota bacterium]